MNNGINLLDPNKNKTTIVPARNMLIMRIIAGGLLFAVSVTSIVLFILVAVSPLPELRRQEASYRLTLSAAHPDMAKLALLDERTTAVSGLLSQRKSYEQILEFIQGKLSSDVAISTIQVDNKTMALTVDSRSLQSLDTFLNKLILSVQEKKGFSQ